VLHIYIYFHSRYNARPAVSVINLRALVSPPYLRRPLRPLPFVRTHLLRLIRESRKRETITRRNFSRPDVETRRRNPREDRVAQFCTFNLSHSSNLSDFKRSLFTPLDMTRRASVLRKSSQSSSRGDIANTHCRHGYPEEVRRHRLA